MEIQTMIPIYLNEPLESDSFFAEAFSKMKTSQEVMDAFNQRLKAMLSFEAGDCVAYWIEDGLSSEEKDERHKAFVFRLAFVVSQTGDRYLALINAFEQKKGVLLDRLKSSIMSRDWYNDTPQSSNLNDQSEDLTHLSEFDKKSDETESDPQEMADRIKTIERSISNYWDDWVKEILGRLSIHD